MPLFTRHAPAAAAKPAYDWSNESVHYEGPPHRGDLVTNLVMGATLAWLPLTFAAVGRAIYVTYRFTDKRMSVTTVTPFKSEQTDIAYQEVKDVVIVGRGVGLWGDMVVTLKDGSKVELRALDKYKELRDYVVARRDELAPAEAPAGSSKGAASTPRGKVVTQEELMSGADAKKGKGFS